MWRSLSQPPLQALNPKLSGPPSDTTTSLCNELTCGLICEDSGEGPQLWAQQPWAQILTLLKASCVKAGTAVSLSVLPYGTCHTGGHWYVWPAGRTARGQMSQLWCGARCMVDAHTRAL